MKLREIFQTVSDFLNEAAEENAQKMYEDRAPCYTSLQIVREFLREQGFYSLAHGSHSEAFACDKWGGVVLKFAFTYAGVDKVDLEEHPFLACVWLRPLFSAEFVLVQPLCETEDKTEAWYQVKETLSNFPSNPRPWDAHDIIVRNVGWFRGRAVAFDIRPCIGLSWDSCSPSSTEGS